MMAITYSQAPPTSSTWFILDVGQKKARSKDWVALLIDVDPDEYRSGLVGYQQTQSCWLELGKHKTRDDAWDVAEQLIATRH